jgi:hypothetical protein
MVKKTDRYLTVCQADRFLTVCQTERYLTVCQSNVPITTRIKGTSLEIHFVSELMEHYLGLI